MRRAPGLLACLLALALAVSGCNSKSDLDSGSPASPSDRAAASPSTTPEATAAAVTDGDLVALLAGAGIGTYDDPAGSDPVRPVTDQGLVKVTSWQVQNMQLQLAGGRGYLGRDLDGLTADTSAGAQPVPISVVVAAWVSAAQTPAADAARSLMGDHDWAHDALDIVYPTAVLTLFTADVATSTAAESGVTIDPARASTGSLSVQPAVYAAAAADGPCSAVQGFVDHTISSIVQALTVEESAGATGVLGTIWNVIVSIAATAAHIALGLLKSTLLAPIQKVIQIIGVLTTINSLLARLDIKVAVTPGGSLQPGTDAEAKATVDAGTSPWPPYLLDCASFLTEEELPDPAKTAGSTVTWKVTDPDSTVTYGATETTVADDKTTAFDFATKPEDGSLATGAEHPHDVTLGLTVARSQIDKLGDLIDKLVVGFLPKPIQNLLLPLLGPVTGPLRQKLTELASDAGPVTDLTTITHDPPEPTPGQTEDPCAATGAAPSTIPDGKWAGPITMQVTGTSADVPGGVDSTGTGQMTLTVADGKVHGSWKVGWHSSGSVTDNGVKVKLDVDGKVQGTASGSPKQPGLDDNWGIKGQAVVTVVGTTQSVPIQDGGSGHETLTIVDTSCSDVTGTFVPSFNTKGNPNGVSFTGEATWTGSRVD